MIASIARSPQPKIPFDARMSDPVFRRRQERRSGKIFCRSVVEYQQRHDRWKQATQFPAELIAKFDDAIKTDKLSVALDTFRQLRSSDPGFQKALAMCLAKTDEPQIESTLCQYWAESAVAVLSYCRRKVHELTTAIEADLRDRKMAPARYKINLIKTAVLLRYCLLPAIGPDIKTREQWFKLMEERLAAIR